MTYTVSSGKPKKRGNESIRTLEDEPFQKRSSLLHYFTPARSGARGNNNTTKPHRQHYGQAQKKKQQGSSSRSVSARNCNREVILYDTSTPPTETEDEGDVNVNPVSPSGDACTLSTTTPPSSVSSHSQTSVSVIWDDSISTACSISRGKNTRKNVASAKKCKGKSSSQQLYLDFGQSNFGQRTICKTCHHLYVNGQPEDEANHKKICRQYALGVPFLGWKDERVVQRYASSTDDISTDEFRERKININEGDRIVEVRWCDASQRLRKIEQVKEIVDDEMGFASSSGSKVTLEKGKVAFLYVSKKRVVGLCIVQVLRRAYILGDNQSRSNQSYPALMGIYQIWTHQNTRRSSIATKLVDAARRKLVYGTVIPLDMIAFSSPTNLGAKFARNYTRMERPKVYEC